MFDIKEVPDQIVIAVFGCIGLALFAAATFTPANKGAPWWTALIAGPIWLGCGLLAGRIAWLYRPRHVQKIDCVIIALAELGLLGLIVILVWIKVFGLRPSQTLSS